MMGLFGGGNSGAQGQTPSDMLIEQQFQRNQAETEQKKKDIYAERLNIIKSQGGQTWTPDRSK